MNYAVSSIRFGAALTLSLAITLGLTPRARTATPTVFWASDPVRPAETVVLVGEGLTADCRVEVARFPDTATDHPAKSVAEWPGDGQSVQVLDAGGQGLKFVVPDKLQPGVFAFRIAADNAVATGVLNRPLVWWAQGDRGSFASPGGWLTVFGRNLRVPSSATPTDKETKVSVRLEGPKSVTIPGLSLDSFSARATLPKDLPAGEYRLWVHHGAGGPAGWSESVTLHVEVVASWPQTVFNVRELGADGDGLRDDTAAVLGALQKVEAVGGGIVFFPRGRYKLSAGLVIPPKTVLRGEKREWSALAWTDLDKPPEALVRGSNCFGLEELTLYAKDHQHVIVSDLGKEPDAGNVFLHRVRVRADVYRGHPKVEEVDRRFRQQQKLSTGGGDTVRLGGANIEILDSDFYGSGRSLYLSRVRGGRIERNRFFNGRWGWISLSGSNGLVFANNELIGADLMSTGGGINCLDGSAASEHVYYAHNSIRLAHGWDREAMTTDAGDGIYFGDVSVLGPRALKLTEVPKWQRRNWVGAGVFILDGKGAGQARRLAGYEADRIEIDRSWAVAPDESSRISITMFQGRYLIVGNEFTDVGAMQFYGTSIDCIVAGNRGTRMPGFRDLGLWYHGYQPSWYCQLLDNEILEGNYYHWNEARDAQLEVYGAKRDPYQGPLNIGAVVRGNRLCGQAHIRVAGSCRDALVENNRIAHATRGIFISGQTQRVTQRDNQFEDVAHEVTDEVAERKLAEEKLARFMGRREPVAIWDFEQQIAGQFVDGAGNGFLAAIEGTGVTVVEDGRRGKAVKFDGTGWLRVSETAVFNAPELTVSFWMKPQVVTGRRGLIGKRFGGGAAPWIVSQYGASIGFEATAPTGKWPWNFRSPALLAADRWTHVAAVMQRQQVSLFVDGRPAGQVKLDTTRVFNGEPLLLGRESWGGDPPRGNTPGLYLGLLDEVKIWTRILSSAEIQEELQASGDHSQTIRQ